MVWSGDLCVLYPVPVSHLLTRLNTHLYARNQHTFIGQLDRSLLHNEPLTCAPLLVVLIHFDDVMSTLHADNGLLVLAHGQLFEVIVRLEHRLTEAGAGKPCGLKTLHLHPGISFLGIYPSHDIMHVIDWIQGKARLPILSQADLQSQREVGKVDSLRWICCRGWANGPCLFVEDQATHTIRRRGTIQFAQDRRALRDAIKLPTDVVLLSLGLLKSSLALQPLTVVLSEVVHHDFCHAFTMHEGKLLGAPLVVCKLWQRQATMLTEHQLLAVGVRVPSLERGFSGTHLGGRVPQTSRQLCRELLPSLLHRDVHAAIARVLSVLVACHMDWLLLCLLIIESARRVGTNCQ
mmetsp:Transcript_24696/g.61813  ORF Transcript_24696/g.61813 Transcript_24696/m.61813 type:complete len:349 (-) Transcript_24696:1247-2293(-)